MTHYGLTRELHDEIKSELVRRRDNTGQGETA